MVWLPPVIRRPLDERDERIRRAAEAEGLERGRREGFREGVREGRRREVAAHDPSRFQYLFVVTYGRSGSTLVQGLLNTLPRTLVRGENDLFMLHHYRAHAAIRGWQSLHRNHAVYKRESAFYGTHVLSPEAAARAMNETVVQSLLGRAGPRQVDTLGFKEVLWHRIEAEETADFFEVLEEAFPGAKYVLNTRDVDRVVGSGFWQRVPVEEARAKVGRVVEIQDFLRSTRPDQTFDLSFEVLTGDDLEARDALLSGLGAFVLGREISAEVLESLQATMLVSHGPKPFSRVDEGGAQPPTE